ncbi:MAG: adenylyl-sulfate kinase [Candidatus Gracilibacteria bacterium]|nr:adenylyl-sulfate kinase [Candidatus Gracilibacteria bacterium]
MSKIPKKGFVLWLTGLSGAGKSTVADNLYNRLTDEGFTHIERLDGDIVRENLTKDLGFTKEDRKTNLERVAFVAKLLSRNGVGVISTFISPYETERAMVKNHVSNYIEVFVNATLETCEDRDVKGLYKKAREGIIPNFTGISDPYEAPANPHIELKTGEESIDESVKRVYDYLVNNGYF